MTRKARKARKPLEWQDSFFAALAKTRSPKAACRAAGVASGTVYSHRGRKADFAARWDAALAATAPETAAETAPEAAGDAGDSRSRYWRAAFFEALAETSNIAASAASVNMPTRTIYKLKREDREFALKMRAALVEGYDHLEMDLLGYLRDPRPERKIDVAAALRLLAAHRETVERERALREEDDDEAVKASIVTFLERMRQRRLANEKILLEGKATDVAE